MFNAFCLPLESKQFSKQYLKLTNKMRKFKYEIILPATANGKETVRTIEAGISQPNKEGGLLIYEGGNIDWDEIAAVTPKNALVIVSAIKQKIVEETKTPIDTPTFVKADIDTLLQMPREKFIYVWFGRDSLMSGDVREVSDTIQMLEAAKEKQSHIDFAREAQGIRYKEVLEDMKAVASDPKKYFIAAKELLALNTNSLSQVWFGSGYLVGLSKETEAVKTIIVDNTNSDGFVPVSFVQFERWHSHLESLPKVEEKPSRISKSDIKLVVDTIIQHGMQSDLKEDNDVEVFEELVSYLYTAINKPK